MVTAGRYQRTSVRSSSLEMVPFSLSLLSSVMVAPLASSPNSGVSRSAYKPPSSVKSSLASLISFCGGNSKASEIKNMIAAFNDMEKYYRPLCDDDTQFDIKKFHGFVELQRSAVIESLTYNGYTKTDFSQWMIDDKFSILQDVRRIPDILKSKKATEVFLKSDTASAKKILAVEELSSDKLKDVPYELLAKELSKRMQNILLVDIHHLRSDSEYADKLNSLMNAYDDIKFVLDEVNGED